MMAQKETSTPSPSIPQKKIQRTESCAVAIMDPSEEEKSHPTTTPQNNTEGETAQKKTTATEIVSVSDILRKLRRDSGLYGFIPLSIGKYLQDVWWEPTSCEILEKRKATGAQWMLLDCKIFLDFSPKTMDVDDRDACVKFKCDPDDILKISYLRYRLMADLHSEKTEKDYNEWYFKMAQKFRMEEGVATCEFAKNVFDNVASLVITRVPGNFHLFHCKRPHTDVTGVENFTPVENRNSILCKATGKTDFMYEFRVSFFVVCSGKEYDKKRREMLEEDEAVLTLADSQPY